MGFALDWLLLYHFEPLFLHQLHNGVGDAKEESLFALEDVLSEVQVLFQHLKAFLAILIFNHSVHIHVVLSAVLN